MPDRKGSALVKTVETLATQKEELASKEKELVETLNAALVRMGYRVVPVAGGVLTGQRRGRPPAAGKVRAPTGARVGAGRKRGRRPMSPAERNVVSRRMKAYWAKRKKATAKKPAGEKAK
jgi:hypothetical protein